MSRAPLAALCLVALTLAACERGAAGPGANAKLCYDFKAKSAPVGPDGATAVDDCTRRWAYSLASSRDEADAVAEAVSVACATALSRWNQATLAQPDAGAESASLITGQPTTPLAEHNTFTHSRALLYVVQARAGNCAPPPAKDGVPEGVS